GLSQWLRSCAGSASGSAADGAVFSAPLAPGFCECPLSAIRPSIEVIADRGARVALHELPAPGVGAPTEKSAALSSLLRPSGWRARLFPDGGAAAAAPRTSGFEALPQPSESRAAPPASRSASPPPVAASPPP